MRGQREYLDYLQDILDATRKARRFVADMEYDEFAADDKTLFAVVRALEVIGEATKKVPHSVRARYPTVPWRDMAGIRDKLIHEYYGVNLQVVWRTLQEDLPPLEAGIQQVIEGIVADQAKRSHE